MGEKWQRQELVCQGAGALPVGLLVVGHGGLDAVVPLLEQRELYVDRDRLRFRAGLEGRARLERRAGLGGWQRHLPYRGVGGEEGQVSLKG